MSLCVCRVCRQQWPSTPHPPPPPRWADCRRKLEAYRSAGVRAYWIVDPRKETVTIYDFEGEDKEPKVYGFTDVIRSGIVEDLELDFAQLQEYLR